MHRRAQDHRLERIGRKMFSKKRSVVLLALAGILSLSLFAAACGDDDDDRDTTPAATAAATSESTPAPDETPRGGAIDTSGVPELEDGVLNIGSDIAYAPIEFFDESNTAVGLDVDLANAMAEVLGIEISFANGAFDGLLPSLAAGRHDAIMSAMTATDDRKQTVDFVEYFTAGSGIIVPTGNPNGITSIEDLCGLRVAVQEGTIQVEYLEGSPEAGGGMSEDCVNAGGDEITVLKFPSDPEAVQALLAGQADAEIADYPVATYSVTQNEGRIEIVSGYQFDPGNYGIAVRKTSSELRTVLEAALARIKADGTYDTILAKWELEAGALP
jgi:polar amino acid transport system substrate-binding protein